MFRIDFWCEKKIVMMYKTYIKHQLVLFPGLKKPKGIKTKKAKEIPYYGHPNRLGVNKRQLPNYR